MTKRMAYFIGGSAARLLLLLAAVSAVSFVLLANSPIDPIDAYFANKTATAEQHALVAAYWGFDKPPLERFLLWVGNILHGDFGTSLIYRAPVLEVIGEKFRLTLLLMLTAWVLWGVIGFTLGVLAGMYRGSRLDKAIQGFSLLCVSVPVFWLGLLFLMIFAVKLQWFPLALAAPIGKLHEEVTLADQLRHVVLPALTLSVTGISAMTLQTREKMIEVMGTNYMLFAEARGESLWQRVRRHGLRNILMPVVTLQFASFNELFGGAVLAETVFAYPGLGGTVTMAGLRGDLSLLLGIAIFSAVFVFAGNLIANILYGIVDPQLREGRGDS